MAKRIAGSNSPPPRQSRRHDRSRDAFCGGFLAAYLQDQADLRRAARLASISASYAVASFGMSALLFASPAQVAHHLSDAGVVYGD